jgi:hypothetical protein
MRKTVTALFVMAATFGALAAGDRLPREAFRGFSGGGCVAGEASPYPGYDEGVARAREAGRPLVVFNGVPARDVPGCVVAKTETLAGFRPGVVVSWFDPRGVHRGVYLGPGATDAAVYDALVRNTGTAPAELRAAVARPVERSPGTVDVGVPPGCRVGPGRH